MNPDRAVVVGLAPDSPGRLVRAVLALDAAGVDAVVLPGAGADTPDALLVASATAPLTRWSVLVPAVSPWEQPPFLTARALCALDALSGGRVGWWVSAAAPERGSTDDSGRWNPWTAGDAERSEALGDLLAACRALWGSWEPGAVVADVATGRYVDASKVHPVDHQGRYYRTRGPLNCPPGPRGRPVLLGRADEVPEADVVVVADERAVSSADGARTLLAVPPDGVGVPTAAAGWFVGGVTHRQLGALLHETLSVREPDRSAFHRLLPPATGRVHPEVAA